MNRKEALLRTLREGAAALERATSDDDVAFVVSTVRDALAPTLHDSPIETMRRATQRLERLLTHSVPPPPSIRSTP